MPVLARFPGASYWMRAQIRRSAERSDSIRHAGSEMPLKEPRNFRDLAAVQ